jgi:hypothetical protein
LSIEPRTLSRKRTISSDLRLRRRISRHPDGREDVRAMSETGHISEFAAAFFGAVAAFLLEALRRRHEERKADLAAGNEAIMVLAQMYSVLRNYNQQAFVDRAIEVHRRMGREPVYIEYLPMTVAWSERSTLPMNRLGFLLESHDEDILNRLSACERGFLTMLATNDLRNKVHLQFQERARTVLGPNDAVPGQVVEESVGMDLALQLKQLTSHLISDVPRTIDDLLSLAKQLRGVLDLEFPTGRTIGFSPIAAPTEGLSPTVSTRKAVWWRRRLRALVNRWRRPR